jgi:hypothetical protein
VFSGTVPTHEVRRATERDQHRERWAAVGLTALVVVVIGVALYAATRELWLPTGDDALMTIRSQDAAHQLPLTGPYSRFGFDHPGPMIFYLQFPFIHLFGTVGALIGSAVVAAGSVAAAGWVAWRRGRFWLSVLTSSVLMLFVRAMGSTVVDPWNPWVALLPSFACILLAWSVWCRDWWALPVLVALGSLAGQTHLSYAPFVGLMLVGAFGWTAYASLPMSSAPKTHPRRTARRVLLGSGLLVVVLWLPPMVDQVRSANPNLTAITRHFAGNDPVEDRGGFTGGQRPGGAQVVETVAAEMGVPSPWIGATEEIDAFTGEVVPASVLRLLPTIAIFAAAFVVGWRRRLTEALRLQVVVAVLTVLGVASLSRITGGVFPYLVRWLWVFGALAWLSSLWTFASAYQQRRGAPARRVEVVALAVPAVACILTVGTLLGAVAPGPTGSRATAALIGTVADALPVGTVLVTADGADSIDVRAGLVAELDRRGFDVVVPDDDAHRFGDSHAAGDRAVGARLDVVSASDPSGFQPSADQRLLTRYDPLSPAQRTTYERLRPRVEAAYAEAMNGKPVVDPLNATDRQTFGDLDQLGRPVAVYLRTVAD